MISRQYVSGDLPFALHEVSFAQRSDLVASRSMPAACPERIAADDMRSSIFVFNLPSFSSTLQDAHLFRRKKWKYLILDEAHMIKNWKSQRWQTLLRFNSKRRLLITGTPLQVGGGLVTRGGGI